MDRRDFLKASLAGAALAVLGGDAIAAKQRLNFVLINCDDLGYGDVSCYGSQTIATPNVDALARAGVRFTDFYACAPVCTPSRAGLLTGRYPIRSGLTRVLFPHHETGLPDSEITLAAALKGLDYATACIGKWHLGHLPQFLPTKHGFDYYYGIPYSNDMRTTVDGRSGSPLMRNETIVEHPAIQDTLTRRYTEETIGFIKQHRGKPFLVYLAHNMPHRPVAASERFKGKSKGGLYGDAVEEIDWGVGEIVKALRELGLERSTVVMFTSDNGPQLGSAGILRGKKGMVFEGGVREPFVAYCPGLIPKGIVCRQPASNLDLFPTILRWAGGSVPGDRVIDGRDIRRLFTTPGAAMPEYAYFHFRTHAIQAVRYGRWKLHVGRDTNSLTEPELYNLDIDVRERVDRAERCPEVVRKLQRMIEEFKKTLPETATVGGSPESY